MNGSTRHGPAARTGLAAPYALVTGYAALLAIGTVAAALHGRFSATGVLIASAAVVAAWSFAAEPLAVIPLGIVGWLTAVGFAHPPYAQLRLTGPHAANAAIVMAACALAGAALGLLMRWLANRPILEGVGAGGDAARPGPGPAGDGVQQPTGGWPAADRRGLMANAAYAVGARRALLGVLLAAVGLPLLTALLVAARPDLSLTDDLLIYLVAVVALAVIGGFWPAVLAAASASLLLNWYFTPPLHTFTIDKPDNLLALLLFVTVAVAVSSVVHLAASRAGQAARSREEARLLLALAQTVLSGADTPAAVLDHLVQTLGGRAELQENVSGRWVRIAASGSAAVGAAVTRLGVRSDLALEVSGQPGPIAPGLLAGFAAQAAAALDRERLRTQASQAEALAEGNRMRTALLAAVSHDLRTPLASIKASVSSLRQTDVAWTESDKEALLATIEENADRLDGLIGNLLDMSRLHTGSLQPFLRPITIDEVAPIALRGLDESANLRLEVPDGMPLVLADPGLLERVLANLFSNALHHSPPTRPPVLQARPVNGTVVLEVIDHGPGVPDKLKIQIFEPFQRFDNRKVGVGLGLAVAKGFTEAMGGGIVAADTPGGGLTVRITLPVASRGAESMQGADS
jgi:two-component system, OmpR family, sensor histidine kinase KdpD